MSLSKITNRDYEKILEYYNIEIPNSNKELAKKATDILSEKLCRCIKKVEVFNPTKKSRAVGICTKSVLNKKGYTRGKFTCKNKNKNKPRLEFRRKIATRKNQK